MTSMATFHRKFDSNPEHVARIRVEIEAFARQIGFTDRCVDEIGLVANEAIANVLEHAYQHAGEKPIEIWAEAKNGGIEIRLRDWGPGVDPSKLPRKEKDPLVPGGLGLICMREMMDNSEYTPQPPSEGGGMLLTLFRHLSSPHSRKTNE